MLKQLWRWLTEVVPDPQPTRVEPFGGTSLDASLGLAVLSDSRRRSLCRAIRESMDGLQKEERDVLLDRLFLRFALYVMDLQASEKHHHAVPFGLLDHSLEVTLQVARKMSGPPFRVSEDYATNYHQKPPWQYAAIVCALLHDAGKAQDLDVVTPDGKDRWDPVAEPLALFCHRNGLTKTGPEFWRYRAGRGVRFHSWHGPMVFNLVLPPGATPYLGHRLALVSDAMIAETLDRAPEAPNEIAERIARIIHESDVETSKASRAAEATPSPEPPSIPLALDAGGSLTVPAPPPIVERPVRAPRTPLDLGAVLGDFTAALRASIEQGVLPLNKEGGLYVGRKHVYLHYREGMEKVLDLMIARGSDLEDRFEEDAAAHPDRLRMDFTPEDRVFQALLAHHRMPYSDDQRAWVQQGEIAHPGDTGEPWEGQVVLMTMPFPDLPRFQGKLDLDGIGDPESDSATHPLKRPPKEAPEAPLVRHSRQEAYDMRVDAELEPARLLATLQDALASGVLHRPGAWSPVYIRPDFTWVVVPETFKILFPRMGIRFTEELENRLLRSIEQIPNFVRSEAGRALFRIKVHPESLESVWALALDTARILSPEQLSALGPWDFPIRVVESPTPGEYAVHGDSPARRVVGSEAPADEWTLETRRLRSFSTLYAKLSDLYARQAEVRKALVDMNEEFTRLIPKSRLVLYLKRKDSSFDYSALHWGFTIPGLKSSPMGAGGHRVRRIKHVSTPLNDSVIHSGGGISRRALFYDFDRRRLAANGAYKKVTKAITTIRQILKAFAGKLAGPAPDAPLPPEGAPPGMSPEALETATMGWRLICQVHEKELQLLRLARGVEVARTDPRLRMVFSVATPDADFAQAHWTLDGAPIEKLTYAGIRNLRIPEAHQKTLSRVERSRRDILKVLEKSRALLEKLLNLPARALCLAQQGLREASRKEVDGYGRSLARDEWVG
jgi:hypothetical protein